MSACNLTTKLLAQRWNIRPATLRQWRWYDKGPRYFKVGGQTLYRMEEIERFEESVLQEHTTITDDMAVDFLNLKNPEDSQS